MIDGRQQNSAELRGLVEQDISKSEFLAGVENLLICFHMFQARPPNTAGTGTVARLEVRAYRRRA